jgi:hypothetical protein
MLVRESGRHVATRHQAQQPIDAFAKSCCRRSMGTEQGPLLTAGDPRRVLAITEFRSPWSCFVQAIEQAAHLGDADQGEARRIAFELVRGLDKNLILCTLNHQRPSHVVGRSLRKANKTGLLGSRSANPANLWTRFIWGESSLQAHSAIHARCFAVMRDSAEIV